MMKKFGLTQILVVIAIWSHAQSVEKPRVIIQETVPASKSLQNTRTDRFAQFDKSVIKTGFLVDKVSDSSSFASLTKAQSKERAGSTGDWISTYHTLKSAEVSGSNVMKRDQLYAGIDELYSKKSHDSIPLGWIAIAFESIKSDAIQSNKIKYNSLKPIEIRDSKDLTDEHLKISISPLQEYLGTSGAVTFYFPDDYIFTNIELSQYPLSIDFDDGKGFQPLDFNKGYTVDYQTNGPKEIVVKSNSETQLAKNASPSMSAITSSSTLMVSTNIPNPVTTYFSTTIPTPYQYAGLVEANLYEYYSGPLDNPIIVIDGFDPGNERDWWETNDSNDPGLYELLNQNDFMEDAKTLGYDFIVIDNIAGADYIERNAYLLAEVIDKVNNEKIGDNELIIVGPSMGGLIARIALKQMEDQNRDHHTRLWVSFDSPQKGANVPLGLQKWIAFFAGVSDKAEDGISKLRQSAGKQLLLYHESGGSNALTTERSNFQSFLNTLGYPSDVRKIAISNGSGIGRGIKNNADLFIQPGDRLLTWEKWDPLFNIKGNVWSVPVNSTQKIFDGKIGLSWTVGLVFFPVGFTAWALIRKTSSTSFVGGTYSYDIMPGGWKDLPRDMADPIGGFLGPVMGDITTNTNNVCHIPLFSALDLPISFTSNIATNHSLAVQTSPFDELYYALLDNEEHIHISSKTHADVFKELVPEVLEIDPDKGWDEGDIIATQSIKILPGFKSKPGKTLYIDVVPNKLNPIGL